MIDNNFIIRILQYLNTLKLITAIDAIELEVEWNRLVGPDHMMLQAKIDNK